jgi:hypothetical protein
LIFGALSAFSPGIYTLYAMRGLCGFGEISICKNCISNYLALLLIKLNILGIGGAHVAFTLFAEFLPSKSRAKGLFLCVIVKTKKLRREII